MSKRKETDIRLLDCVYQFVEANGWAPSVRELCTLSGVSSTSTVSHRLTLLENAGFIERRQSIPRAMRVTVLGRSLLKEARTA